MAPSKMNKIFPLLALLIGITLVGIAQVQDNPAFVEYTTKFSVGPALTDYDKTMLSALPELKAPAGLLRDELPPVVDNSTLPYLRPVFNQVGASCGQACAIGYNFTYEINAARGLPADTTLNQYATHFTWNFMNGGNGWYGVSYFHSFEILRLCGNMNVNDYGGTYYDDGKRWITGYDVYYNAMHNRITGAYQIKTNTAEGIETLKHWLHDHMGKSGVGGVASFYANVPFNVAKLNDTTPQGGKFVMTEWYPDFTHAMTIVGYNDSIRWDYNGDGQYTNDIDINGDGEIDPRDWEIGGVKFVNSHGVNALDSGFCYMMYKVIAEEKDSGGIYNQAVHVVDVKTNYEPALALKVSIEHDYRQAIKVMAGISTDTTDSMPEETMSFPIFNYQGGNHYMQGHDTANYLKTIEFGLDITPLQSYIEPGAPFKLFILVDENDPFNNGMGSLVSCSLMDYNNNNGNETSFQGLPVNLTEDGTTVSSLIHSLQPGNVEITTEELPPFSAGEAYSYRLEAAGGTTPYQWKLEGKYLQNQYPSEFPQINETQIMPNAPGDTVITVDLPFTFPFFGKAFDSLYIFSDGFIQFEKNYLPWPYLIDYELMLRSAKMISPLVNKDFDISGENDGVWYSASADSISFKWAVTLFNDESYGEYEFAATLFPDGRIKFLYGECDALDFLKRASGISAGDHGGCYLTPLGTDDNITDNYSAEFRPCKFPTGMIIDSAGVFKGAPSDAEQIYDIAFTVTDDRNISDTKIIPLTSGLMAEFEATAGSDERIDYGDQVQLAITIKNLLDTDVSNLLVTISTDDPYITMNDDTESVGNLSPGQEVTISGAFSFDVSYSLPDKHNIFLEALLSTDEQTWRKELIYTGYSPVLTLENFEIDDPNGILEPGESADLILTVRNTGHSSAYNVSGELISGNSGVIVNTAGQQPVGDLLRGTSAQITFNLSADDSMPNGQQVLMNLDMMADHGISSYDSLLLRIGKVPVAVIDLDPNNHSAPGIYETLQDMDIISESWEKFPRDLNQYQSLFICLGVFFSNHVLTWPEGLALADYLDNGGKIYLEGRETWLDDPQTPVHSRFKILPEENFASLDSIAGVDSVFTEGLLFYNEANHPINFYWIKPAPGAFTILTRHNDTIGCGIAYDGGTYKTIGTITEFGTLAEVNPPGAKYDLMDGYLDFFGVNQFATSIDEPAPRPQAGTFNAFPNPFSDQVNVSISLEKASKVKISIFNLAGRLLGSSYKGNLPEGEHTLPLRMVKGAPPGIYLCRIELDQTIISGKIVKISR